MKGFFNRFFHKPGNVSFGNEPIQAQIADKLQRRIVVTQTNLLSSRQTSRDENLRAKLPGGGGRVKEERKRERLSERPVVSLTRPTTPHNQRGFHRAVPAASRMARNFTISDWKI